MGGAGATTGTVVVWVVPEPPFLAGTFGLTKQICLIIGFQSTFLTGLLFNLFKHTFKKN